LKTIEKAGGQVDVTNTTQNIVQTARMLTLKAQELFSFSQVLTNIFKN